MKACFILSKEDINIAEDEVLALFGPKDHLRRDNILIIDTSIEEFEKYSKRLAYTKRSGKVLFVTATDNLIASCETFDWQSEFRDNFSLRLQRKDNTAEMNMPETKRDTGAQEISEKRIAGIIWNLLSEPAVNLREAKSRFEIYVDNGWAVCIKLLEINYERFDLRKAHNRPEHHPTSMHPRLARALVNLTGIRDGTITDPFCGSGGMLIEAGLMGLSCIGHDIDEIMTRRCIINMEHFGITNFRVDRADATMIEGNIDYLTTDLPYGRNCKAGDLKILYGTFLSNLRSILKIRAVISFPDMDDEDYRGIIERNGFRIISEYGYYIHKSLSKMIYVLEP